MPRRVLMRFYTCSLGLAAAAVDLDEKQQEAGKGRISSKCFLQTNQQILSQKINVTKPFLRITILPL